MALKAIVPIEDLYTIVTEIGELPEQLDESKIKVISYQGKVYVTCCVEHVVLALLEGQETVEVTVRDLNRRLINGIMEDKPLDFKVSDLLSQLDYPEVQTVEDLVDEELTEEHFAEEIAEEEEELDLEKEEIE